MNVSALQFSRSMGRSPRLTLDPLLVSCALALLLLGLVMVTSASISIAEQELGSPFAFLERQLMFATVGCCLGLVAFRLPTELWERISFALLLIGLLLLVLVLVPGIGHAVNGSRRWLRIGMFNFQASELARLLILIHICSYAVRRQEELRTTMMGVLKPLGLLTLGALLLLLEPDFGAAAVLLITGFAILFIAGISWRHVLLVLAIGGAGLGLIAISSAYRVRRLTTFLDPWADPFNSGFQLTQSLIAIGRGEWFGVGLGASVQKLFYLPEAHTDFVFAVLAEELGLAGVLLVLTLFVVLVWRCCQIARQAGQGGRMFQAYLAAAFGIWVGLQAFINIGVNMGVLPTKGLTLPLMSYGRSSLLVTLAWLGVVLRIGHECAAAGRLAVPRAENTR
ncbi:MAG TPA: putative lipid II flippase FtsW [Steroidobacteraceae bacterium]|jgi:cell division protein FtsW|nr:putative lipid II flippase FtsW [Steroidobacteraceae bacterium]